MDRDTFISLIKILKCFDTDRESVAIKHFENLNESDRQQILNALQSAWTTLRLTQAD